MLTHCKSLRDQDYFGAYALKANEDLTVTIVSVERKTITVAGGRQDAVVVVNVLSHKPIILNATNEKSIIKLYGPFVENWQGQKITLYASTTSYQGENVECFRIRPYVAKRAKEIIGDERLAAAKEKIKAGEYTREKLLDAFELTTEQLVAIDAN